MQIDDNKIRLNTQGEQTFLDKKQKYDYSKYKNLKDIDWDDELASKFFPIAEKLNLSQESLDMLLDIALEMSLKQKDFYEKDEKTKYLNNVEIYNKQLNEDSELPSVNSAQMKEYMRIANGAYSDFTTPKLKEILENA